MKELDFFDIIGSIADDLVLEETEVPMKQHKRITHPAKIILITAAIAAALTGTALAVMHYTKSADALEHTWNDMASDEMAQSHKDTIEAKSADLGESVTDQGITITVDSVSVTNDTAYLFYTVALPRPDAQGGEILRDTIQLTASDGNTYFPEAVVADRLVESSDSGASYYRILSCELPDGITLSHGQMTMDISSLTLNDMEQVEGTWSFSFTLPEVETAQSYYLDQTLSFSQGIDLEISDLSISQSRITFDYACTKAEAMILDGDAFTAQEVNAADPDVQYICTFQARLSDGTSVPVTGGSSVYRESRQVNECAFYWSVPIDLSMLEAIVFSDGTTEIQIPVP